MNTPPDLDSDGVRFNWNSLPVTRSELSNLAMPIGCLFTPLHNPDIPRLHTPLVLCTGCNATLNPMCAIDLVRRLWRCCLCCLENTFPLSHTSRLDVGAVPPEVQPGSSTVEYVLDRPPSCPPAYLYVIDTTLELLELAALKRTVLESVKLLPRGSLVGLVTYDKVVQVHQLGGFPATVCIAGDIKGYDTGRIQRILGIVGNRTRLWDHSQRYLSSTSEPFLSAVERLQTSKWESKIGERPLRATGTALAVTTALVSGIFRDFCAHVMLFSGGPATYGPGTVVPPSKASTLRSHSSIEKSDAKRYKSAYDFYASLLEGSTSISYSIFAGSYDQVGVYEMRRLCNDTGGAMVINDSFTTELFRQSFLAWISHIIQETIPGVSHVISTHLDATLEIFASSGLKVTGIIGHCRSLKEPGSCVHDEQVGKGLTRRWKMAAISPRHTYAVFFHVDSGHKPAPRELHFQFKTTYMHLGKMRVRVTTFTRPTSNMVDLVHGFDQEAAIVLLARLAVDRLERSFYDTFASLVQWLDATTIKLCKTFGTYTRGHPETFALGPTFTLFPQFVYHLRRSPFLQVFNSSPDVTAFYHHTLLRANAYDACVMVQPSLVAYSAVAEPSPVVLDETSLQPDQVLFLDAFFYVVIWYGSTAAQWRDAELDMADFSHVHRMFEGPKVEAAALLANRFPLPRYVMTDAGKSQARFLTCKLNPSGREGGIYGLVLTDGVSLYGYMREVTRLVVG
ncbi:hypothetical protein BABINDRAFT_160432 [Babjeviella inositovora NRRL Y-12698]|uniref:Protein transport protein SEC23 n=1 Tax=Babjeviella inositovora NRRL Y-12698 TaxID=984486 RepID=A0A1E3QVB9_9ASCO|nr:uncharacterized protein BABINDRAFT_160432 [Babjeviella inositovora NRRL Y-12698]ODQ81012.1 hypothetical protein BABINDRAFT_160432 [Babjeviella inositovora NRRL Y-12698]